MVEEKHESPKYRLIFTAVTTFGQENTSTPKIKKLKRLLDKLRELQDF